jgi:quaternary ammonium compound-resistance protein SugE
LEATPFTHNGDDIRDGPVLSQGGAVMAWIILLVAGLLEIVWAYTMKLSEGFTRVGPAVITLIAMSASFALLSVSMKSLPLGTAYTIWTGIGAVGAFVVGVTVLGEPLTAGRVAAAVLIVSGLVLMKMST